MSDIHVRGLKEESIVKLDRLAAGKHISREEYLRRLIQKHLMEMDIKAVENKYENLVLQMADVIQNNSEKMEELERAIRRLREFDQKII